MTCVIAALTFGGKWEIFDKSSIKLLFLVLNKNPRTRFKIIKLLILLRISLKNSLLASIS